MLALTYNIAASPLVQAHANALDAFGQPNCSEHANNAPGDRPDGPAGAIPRQFCCPLTAAATLDALVLPAPVTMQWQRVVMTLVALRLPSRSTYTASSPRGPPPS